VITDHTLQVCEDDIQTACGNITQFATQVQLATKMNGLDFKVKGQGHKQTKCDQKSFVQKSTSVPAKLAIEDELVFKDSYHCYWLHM